MGEKLRIAPRHYQVCVIVLGCGGSDEDFLRQMNSGGRRQAPTPALSLVGTLDQNTVQLRKEARGGTGGEKQKFCVSLMKDLG